MLVGLVLLGCVGPTGVHELESLEHAHRLLPSNAEIRLLLSEAYAAVGRYGPARDPAPHGPRKVTGTPFPHR